MKPTMFDMPSEKGQYEWKSFRAIRKDRSSIFAVFSPRKKTEPRYTNVVHIQRYRIA